MHRRQTITSPAQLTIVERARRDVDFVRETLREAETLLLGGERDAADIILRDLAHGAPQTEISVGQAAHLLGVSRDQVEEWIGQGLLGSNGADRRRLVLGDMVRLRKTQLARHGLRRVGAR